MFFSETVLGVTRQAVVLFGLVVGHVDDIMNVHVGLTLHLVA